MRILMTTAYGALLAAGLGLATPALADIKVGVTGPATGSAAALGVP